MPTVGISWLAAVLDKEENMAELKLDLTMEPVERLKTEIEFHKEDPNVKCIGEFLLKQFETDEPLKNAYKERKVTLDAIYTFIRDQARKKQINRCAMVSSEEVFGWAIHFIQDGSIPNELQNATEVTLTEEKKASLTAQAEEEFKQQELARLAKEKADAEAKEKERRRKVLEKEKKEREESGQMTLFDDFNWGDEDEKK